uniref:Uncharacterized protein n=1 Tax=Meloidogyne enterolobii TaxID=390850 RepID=A0A6V7WYL6_MELEN|nr:unnamed protein product [Meloidogyne enterolobii]
MTENVSSDFELIQIDDAMEVENNCSNNQIDEFYVQIKNKWKDIEDDFRCCNNRCINTKKPFGVCIEGNGYINLINKEIIKYYNCVEGKGINDLAFVTAKYKFYKTEDFINYSLFYFEIKYTKIGEGNSERIDIDFGLRNRDPPDGLKCKYEIGLNIFSENIFYIMEYNYKEYKLDNFSWNNGDIFGCGLIYPPTKINEFPYIFFTQNGQIIGKAILLKDNFDCFHPYIGLANCCLVEANFGNDLGNKPFIYNFKKHPVLNEFYED